MVKTYQDQSILGETKSKLKSCKIITEIRVSDKKCDNLTAMTKLSFARLYSRMTKVKSKRADRASSMKGVDIMDRYQVTEGL
ncbi:hypothetical protein AUF14_18280 [Enterococcus avium]|nr:hypothetical protein AUF14_18280 [Enterococcus avium]